MKVFKHPSREQWNNLLNRDNSPSEDVLRSVQEIIETVKNDGDKALSAYTLKFDAVQLNSFSPSAEEWSQAEALVPEELKQAMKVAYKNILTFHTTHRENYHVVETMPGVRCWRKAVPIEKVGIYIPGGIAPHFSTVLMLGIPAKLMGCKEIILCVPPQKDGSIHPSILYAAQLCGLKHIFKVGGAQAIAAMAYGTESIPKVYKIYGPGNAYVSAAKRWVFKDGIAIDMPSGPSELMVVADETMPASFVAADLLSQAEHGVDSKMILVTFKEDYLKKVQKCLTDLIKDLPRKEVAEQSLGNTLAFVVKTQEDARDMANYYAPEHLVIGLKNCNAFATEINNASSIFLGNYSPEVIGKYAAGPNHTLPTGGFSKMFSGIMLESFAKKITYQQLTPEGLDQLGKTTEVLAEHEGYQAHKKAIEIRLAYLNKK
jgi:histidinol dehydrogenase